ncbi:MAG: polysaccharide deacetylase family protein [Clostridia bacterium]|nr:polysaccharide deacetylase family protein [Clostridia bacterium]
MEYRYLRFPEGKGKAVTLSYDDGIHADIRFSDRITKAGLKCTFNINSGFISANEYRLSKEEIREYILDRGHEVAIHGKHHIASGAARPIDTVRDALECRLELESEFDIIVRGMAYPDSGIRNMHNGNSYENVKSTLKSLDIVYARTLAGDNDLFKLPEDFHAWMPTAHHENKNLFEYIDKFTSLDFDKLYGSGKWPRLFYLWGHSYEFDRHDNWDLLDKICDSLGGREDVWYATNMEIYDYVNAYNSLVWSADGLKAYNPTLTTVWFYMRGNIYSVKSGELLVLPPKE